jgi:hypothetical protein
VGVRLGLREQARRLEAPHDVLAHNEAVAGVIGQRLLELRRARYAVEKGLVAGETELGLGVEHVDERQVVAPPDLEIVEVVRWRDLDRASALLRIGIFIGDDRDAPSDHREDGVAPDEVAVALVVRMNGDRDVAQHGLRPRGRDRDEGRRIVRIEGRAVQRIADVPQMPLDLYLLHLEIGDRGQELRIPVDQPLVFVDQPLAMELHEHLDYGAREPFVHGEALARPVARGTEPL